MLNQIINCIIILMPRTKWTCDFILNILGASHPYVLRVPPLGPSPPFRAEGTNPDPLHSKGSTTGTTPLSGSSSSGTARGCVNPQSATSPPVASGCTCAIVQKQSFSTPPHLPSLCFANGFSHIILHTHSNHWALGTIQEVIVAFVRVVPPLLPQRSRAPLSAVII